MATLASTIRHSPGNTRRSSCCCCGAVGVHGYFDEVERKARRPSDICSTCLPDVIVGNSTLREIQANIAEHGWDQ